MYTDMCMNPHTFVNGHTSTGVHEGSVTDTHDVLTLVSQESHKHYILNPTLPWCWG